MTKEEAVDEVFTYLCGCGCPSKGLDGLRALVKNYTPGYSEKISADDQIRALADALQVQEDGVGFWLILYLFDSLEASEHGGGVRFGWLTTKGEKLKEALSFSNEDLLGPE